MASGLTESDVRRLIRRREWVLVHPGVYVNHTGDLTWLQRAWAAVLFAWPAALSHDSALRAADGPGKHREAVIHVAVGRDRRITAPAGVRIHRMSYLAERTLWIRSPPRMRYEDAALDVAIASPTEMAALDVLASAVQSRRTTAERMLTHLDAAVGGQQTVRLGYGQVFARPCAAALRSVHCSIGEVGEAGFVLVGPAA